MQECVRVLILEDVEDDFLLIRHEIERHKEHIETRFVEDLEALEAALKAEKWSLVLSDFYIPGSPFSQILERIESIDPTIPVIVVSGVIDESVAVEVMRAGVKDFIPKDSLSRLMPAIRRELVDAEARREQALIKQFVARSTEVLKRIALGGDIQEVLKDVCLLVDESCPDSRCAIFVSSEDGKYLRLGAAPNLSQEYRDALAEFEVSPNAGTCGSAAFHGAEQVTISVKDDPRWDVCRELPDLEWVKAGWSSPLFDAEGRIIGTYAQYFGEERPPSPEEREVVLRAMEMASIAIQRLRNEEALRASETKLRALTDATHHSMLMVDLAGEEVLFANRPVREVFRRKEDLSPVEAMREYFATLQPITEDASEFFDNFLRGVLDGASGEVVFKDGRVRRWAVSRVDQSKVFAMGRLLTSEDITETRKLEDRLRQASKLEAIGTLAGGIAHDFNNILTPIMGLATLGVNEEQGSDENRKRWRTVLESSRRARDLIRKVLSFSRRSEVKMERTNLSALVSDALNLLKEALPATIEVGLSLGSEPLFVDGDPSSLEQVVFNLATNAFHAMEEQGGKLEISLQDCPLSELGEGIRTASNATSFARLSVKDTGAGIPASDLNRIFDPFYTTKPVGKGTGLGLSQTIGVVHAHEGDMRVASKVNEGTLFEVFLPLSDSAANTSGTIELPLTPNSQDARILVVDDEEPIRELLKECLEACGYQVDTALDGLQAFERITSARRSYHLLITDQTMPRMTGTELIRKLRKQGVLTPVILCTGVIDARFSAELAHLGVSASIAKPISLDQLTSKVADIVEPAIAED